MRGAVVVAVLVCACGGAARLPVEAGTGPTPELPPPRTSLIPVVKVARAVGWSDGSTPSAAADLRAQAFASGLQHPRWLYVLPNGDVLVAETNAPADREKPKGIRGWFMQRYFKKAGAAVPSANRITILRDADGDGVAETRSILLHDLNAPFGMALIGDQLFVANSDAVLRFPYRTGQLTITAPATRVVALPAGPINYHFTKTLLASADGRRLYVTVGSNSNVGERGLENEQDRAGILELDPASGRYRVYASGMRNPVGLAWQDGVLWASVNERDELGSDLVPDYLTSVRDGAFYGWPYSYFGAHLDPRVKVRNDAAVRSAVVPDYALGPHAGSLGLAAATGNSLGARFGSGMFVGQHGSWNRKPFSGYRVIFVPFANGRPTGAQPVTVLDGFLDARGHARGRPVGVALDRRGALLVADDVGNTIWRVKSASSTTAIRN
ncbi:MAG TPA: sorbosone dehydrogenase family protein [Gemmatimonadaceae bacterium]|nr:sorbosone dehydrogenase family protein [Gemmatimonadaceae bacterium]